MKCSEIQDEFQRAHTGARSPIARGLIDVFEEYRDALLLVARIVAGDEESWGSLDCIINYSQFIGVEVLADFYLVEATQQPAWLRRTVAEYCALFK